MLASRVFPPPMSPTLRLPRVLLLIETSTAYSRRIMEGIGRYVRENGPWLLHFEEHGMEAATPAWVA